VLLRLLESPAFRWLNTPILIIGSQFWALEMVIQPPRRYRLRYDPIWEERRRLEQEEMNRKYGAPPEPEVSEQIHKMPPLKSIYAVARFGWFSKETTTAAIHINTETRRLYQSDPWLFRKEYQGSGAIGVFIFGLPTVILSLPIILVAKGYYSIKERFLGMSRHGWQIYKKLRHQLDDETRILLRDALQAEYRSGLSAQSGPRT